MAFPMLTPVLSVFFWEYVGFIEREKIGLFQ